MRILLTGATGYIGHRLLPVLLDEGHTVICAVRDKGRLDLKKYKPEQVQLAEADLLNADSLNNLPKDIDAAYYLVHSMTGAGFSDKEKQSAENFVKYLDTTSAKQLIYLGGIVNSQQLSAHLQSRLNVEQALSSGKVPLTALRAGIIVGSGSASFEIIRDLVEKLPVMVAPKWLKTKCQPIAIRNVIQFLTGVLGREDCYAKHFDIYGPDVLTYKQMLLDFAAVRKLKRTICIVPVMTPRISSYWLYFVTSTSYELAKNLVESMKIDVVGKHNDLPERLNIELIPYKEAIQIAFDKIEQNLVLSSWNDSAWTDIFKEGIAKHLEVPQYGVFQNKQKEMTKDVSSASARIFAIGGRSGWYYADWLWAFRGFLDKLFGGVGLRRGRKNANEVSVGDALDFWRVIYANKQENRLLLYAEMKLPGEAWLEFKIDDKACVQQTATFRPLGLWGRLYWFTMLPFHFFIFKGMLHKIAAG
ncbi:SDR family oxidoreductase [Mucilaginibacter sp. KACC 22063]|uniref:SDR family oxidoreductase n=1 Tax=Mucilaginibacter sp. KACC 22063 TaxID=3025666 RepID=UPI0023661C92|nr:SDR family oxidoreductase [Mucilaginibacter sp. KACC 22063]WDF54437.1 SDR family oxidoreductase [Mucilaginibacter sp. KACC 22063]